MSVLDRTKVIKGLGEALTLLAEYVPGERYLGYAPGACLDAIELLKAQEPVEPEPKEVIYDDEHRSVYCPSCGDRLAGLTNSGAVALETEETPNYCWMCGQVVKW